MIPKILHHIWVGQKPPPKHWMDTWPKLHPTWRYVVWNDDTVFRRKWRNQRLVNAYADKAEWRGVADVIRYEILEDLGGFMPGADSECLRPIDDIVKEPAINTYAVYEHETAAPGLITPVYASLPGTQFLNAMIEAVSSAKPGEPWECVGNALMQKVYEGGRWPHVRIWPSWMFNPDHYSGAVYTGPEQPYARQHWGSTKGKY